ncbi:hypothetical protein [Gramella sp. KN1008]|uniref:hypothetical protein n=1 Tax=Gramella sp. KN1008 TaxID=2529298 RepID=UPI00103A3B60|nr:hypothetical protein [Gramella sp. KN1008]TBW29074.1 hypothetical protein EZJ28_04090 [Gramella sp. KN1008]
MANILDVFRTQAGQKLIERTQQLTGQEGEKVQKALVFTLPAILTNSKSFDIAESEGKSDLISFIEQADLLAIGTDATVHQFDTVQIQKLKSFGSLIEIPEEDFLKILKISTAFLNALITQMMNAEEDADHTEIIETLCGKSLKYERIYIKALVKKGDSPDLIQSSEEIALGEDRKDDDESILGGYSGGR